VLYSRDVIQKKPGQLGSKMHACNRMLDLLELESVLTFPGSHALESMGEKQQKERFLIG
jgi:hypothetical protein